jgi:hypothetical protein
LCDRSFNPLSNVNAQIFGVINQMKTIKNLSIAVIGTAIFIFKSGNAQAATITFSDSTFNNEDWRLIPFIQGNGGVVSNQITSIDNQFRQIINSSRRHRVDDMRAIAFLDSAYSCHITLTNHL